MARNKLLLMALAVALLLPLWATSSAEAQGPRIDRLEIMVLDLNRQERVGTVLPGQTFDMNAGETLRFRMVAVPNGAGERYPSTRFWVASGKSRIKTDAANVEVGNITITALNNNNSRERTVVRYEIVDRGHNIAGNLRTGSFFINVNGRGNANGRQGGVRGNDDWYDDGGYNTGNTGNAVVTLYEHQNYQGRSASFNDLSVANVSNSGFPSDVASSVRLAPGCRATLFEHPDFRGRSATIAQDETDLRYTQLGSDTLSSFQVDCSGNRAATNRRDRAGRAGRTVGRAPNGQTTNSSVTLFEHQNFRGAQETFWSGRLADIKNTGVGVNRASSVRITGNCQVTLYEDTNFEGRVSVITRDVTDLSSERVGNDTVSSIIVDCR